MTKAETMRTIANKRIEAKRAKHIKTNQKYADKLIGRNIYKAAEKGAKSCSIKVGRAYSPTLVVDHIQNQGFEVQRVSKNGRAILVIKW